MIMAQQKKQIERKWLTQTEAAAYLNIDQSTLWKFRKKGLLAFYKVGGHVFYSLAEIDAMILKGRNANK